MGSQEGESQAEIIFLPAFFIFVILKKFFTAFRPKDLQDQIGPIIPPSVNYRLLYVVWYTVKPDLLFERIL